MNEVNLNKNGGQKRPVYTHRIQVPETRKVSLPLREANGENCAILDVLVDGSVKVRTRMGSTFQIPTKWLVGLHKINKTTILPEACACPWSMLIRGCECGSEG
jgi:hypothetical protein